MTHPWIIESNYEKYYPEKMKGGGYINNEIGKGKYEKFFKVNMTLNLVKGQGHDLILINSKDLSQRPYMLNNNE